MPRIDVAVRQNNASALNIRNNSSLSSDTDIESLSTSIERVRLLNGGIDGYVRVLLAVDQRAIVDKEAANRLGKWWQ